MHISSIHSRRDPPFPTSRYPKTSYLEQPDVPEQDDDGGEKGQPDLPADASALSHAKHAIHCAAQTHAGAVERVVHLLGESGRIADFVSDGRGDLNKAPSAFHAPLLYKGPEYARDGADGRGATSRRRLTSFSILTLALMPSSCSSFWLSNSLKTASLYWPRALGVALRKLLWLGAPDAPG